MPAETVDVLIVGTGFSGLGMAIRLLQEGMRSFLVIEKGHDLGGTWYENRYPGCACDIPSHLYSFSFDLNPDWSRMYAGQPEIQEYLKSCARRHGVTPFIRFNTRLVEAAWNEAAKRWEAKLGDGGVVSARVLVSGMGALHVPHLPKLNGIEQFSGPAFHSAQWRADVDLSGKTVAVIGTGASSIQIVPEIASRVRQLYLFQRTPAWILPRMDFPISARWKDRFRRFPAAMWVFRKYLFWLHEIRVLGFLGNRTMRRIGERMARRHLEHQISDPNLRAALTPDYELGCKRVLVSNDFYPALLRENVELVTSRISEVTESGIVTEDGRRRLLDVIIYGTGFHVTEPFIGTRVVGRAGIEIHDAWRQSASALLGITVSGFPNFFMLLGPNTGLGHNSVVLMIEAQIRYIMKCLKLMRRRGWAVMEVREESQRRFAGEMKQRLARTVWQTGGCRSWYQDQKTGENPTIWPGSVVGYILRTRSVPARDFRFE
jgi:cation diffusion facilitator CzcD-associated flavoprotein CzcO